MNLLLGVLMMGVMPVCQEEWTVDPAQAAKFRTVCEQSGMSYEYVTETLEKLGVATVKTAELGATVLFDEGIVRYEYPAHPHVNHHVCVVLNRPVSSMFEIKEEEELALQCGINKVQEIYRRSLDIPGATTVRCVNSSTVEIIPPREKTRHFHDVEANIARNHYFLGLPNHSKEPSRVETAEKIAFWKEKLATGVPKPFARGDEVYAPKDWIQSQVGRAKAALLQMRILQDTLKELGVDIQRETVAPGAIADTAVTPKSGCAFCNRVKVIEPQRFYQGELCSLLYNNKPANRDGHFLIVTHRHVKESDKLSEAELLEIQQLSKVLQKAISDPLSEEDFKDLERCSEAFQRSVKENVGRVDARFYVQEVAEMGQTVPHFHEHCLLPPSSKERLIRYEMLGLNYTNEKTLTPEEMAEIIRYYRARITRIISGA